MMTLQEASKILKIIFEQDINIGKDDVAKVRLAKKTFIDYYKDNPQPFIEDFIKIVHYKTSTETAFILNKAQQIVIDRYKDKYWLAVPKARQLGITTLTNALALHHALFSNNAFVACMAVKNANAEENLVRIRSMFSTMPKWVQALLYSWNDKEYFSNKSQWTFKSLVHNTTSTVEVASAASEDSTRGKRITFCHWTETAFSEIADKVFTSMSPSLRRRPDSRVIMESTGNGATGLYYEICMGKKDGFETVFLPWYNDVDYTKDGELDSSERDTILTTLDITNTDLSDGQLIWYRDTAGEMGVNACQQEYPNTVEQVFLSTNQSFFSVQAVKKVEGKDPIYFMNLNDGFLVRTKYGPCQVWEAPKAHYEYLIVVDSSEGIIDPSSIGVYNPHGEEVAHWHNKHSPDELCKVIFNLAKHFGNAVIAVESNGIGQYVISTLKHQYFYTKMYQEDGKFGVKTSQTSKPVMLSTLQDYILNDKLKFNNTVLAEEMKTFQADTLKALKGDDIHDDVVMQCAITAWVFSKSPPKQKYIASSYRDYSDKLNNTNRTKRNFIIGRS